MYRSYVNQALKYQSDLRDVKLDVVGLKILLLEPTEKGTEKTLLSDMANIDFKIENTRYLKVNTNFITTFKSLSENYIMDELFSLELIIPVNEYIKDQSKVIFYYPNPDNKKMNCVFFTIYSQELKRLEVVYSKKAFCQVWRFKSESEALGFWNNFFSLKEDSINSLIENISLENKSMELDFKNILSFLKEEVYFEETDKDFESIADKTENTNSEGELLFKF